MKIKELFENTTTSGTCSGYYAFDNNPNKEYTNTIEEHLKNLLNRNVGIYIDYENVEFTFNFKISEINELEQMHERIGQSLEQIVGEDPSMGEWRIEFLGLPNTKIENLSANYIVIDCKGLTTLNGIEKIISNQPFLILKNVVNCGILSLFKCKDIQFIEFDSDGMKDKSTVKTIEEIVQKYWESKNILKCQKDLINAGLKDYAK